MCPSSIGVARKLGSTFYEDSCAQLRPRAQTKGPGEFEVESKQPLKISYASLPVTFICCVPLLETCRTHISEISEVRSVICGCLSMDVFRSLTPQSRSFTSRILLYADSVIRVQGLS